MKIHQVRALITVCQHGSFRRASEILHTTQPALSQNIKQLEAELGVLLLERTNRGIHPTSFTKKLLPRFLLIAEELNHLAEDIAVLKDSSHGTVSLGITDLAASEALAGCITELCAAAPGLKITVSAARPPALLAGLRDGRFDMILTNFLPEIETHEVVDIGTLPFGVVVARNHPCRTATSLEELSGCWWTTPDPIDSPNCAIRQLFESHNLPLPEKIVESDSILLMMHLCVAKNFVSYVSRGAIQSQGATAQIILLDLPGQELSQRLLLVYRNRDLLSISARRLADIIEKTLNKLMKTSDMKA